jgi:thiosulfate/3-mercaptopyruvate sulfurtransferase
MTLETIIDASVLANTLGNADLRIIDCRFDLGQPALGRTLYTTSHIVGSVYAHLDEDLSGPRTPWSGRHPLPDPKALTDTFGRWGIDRNTQVIAYDDSAGMYAARLWWLLRWMGHTAVAVLDGGLKAFVAAGGTLSTTPVLITPQSFEGSPDPDVCASIDDVALGLAGHRRLVLDARAPERYAGEFEPLDPRAGHIPGATNHPYTANLDTDGRFLSPSTLRARLAKTLGSWPAEQVISSCGSGVTACHTLLALEIAGLRGARLYPGSYSEWCRDAARPVATGYSP